MATKLFMSVFFSSKTGYSSPPRSRYRRRLYHIPIIFSIFLIYIMIFTDIVAAQPLNFIKKAF